MNMRHLLMILIIISAPSALMAQLTLDSAYAAARKNYPLIKQKDLVRQTADLNIYNLYKGYWPQVALAAQASYQSAVTKVDVPVPGVKIDAPGLDQYRVVADVNQLIYDGGQIRRQRELQELNAVVEDQTSPQWSTPCS